MNETALLQRRDIQRMIKYCAGILDGILGFSLNSIGLAHVTYKQLSVKI
jgi:hypothetical protein